MHFPISGVDVSPVVPVVAGFVIACATTPVGVSGAFLLLPFQFSVLNFTGPGVTPTNLLYNVISTPGGINQYRLQGNIDGPLVQAILTGTIPGVIAGSLLRITVFADPADFKVFVGFVLLVIGTHLVGRGLFGLGSPKREGATYRPHYVVVLGMGAGVIGGIYGISGGSIIAPTLVGVFGLSVRRVASAALSATLITSLAGVASFWIIAALDTGGEAARPDWLLALLFGLGGALGGTVGARFSSLVPERGLRVLLGVLALALAGFYIL